MKCPYCSSEIEYVIKNKIGVKNGVVFGQQIALICPKCEKILQID